MTNALSLIISLGKEGKSPLEIARELHARGVKNENGKTIGPVMVSGFLRFVGKPAGEDASYMPAMFDVSSEAAWGATRAFDAPELQQFHESSFFYGPFGFALSDARVLPFIPFSGCLGFFDVPSHLVRAT
jgi:hypothetical protein